MKLVKEIKFIVNIKYHYHYNCLERFFFEDSNLNKYYVGCLGSEGYKIWQDAKKGDKICIITVCDNEEIVKVININSGDKK